jgi:hypothetical protein
LGSFESMLMLQLYALAASQIKVIVMTLFICLKYTFIVQQPEGFSCSNNNVMVLPWHNLAHNNRHRSCREHAQGEHDKHSTLCFL